MVDFQSRDTRRGPPLDDGGEDDDDETEDEAPPADETVDGADSADEMAADETPAAETTDGADPANETGDGRAADSGRTDPAANESRAEAREPSTEVGADDGTQPTAGADAQATTDPLEDPGDTSPPPADDAADREGGETATAAASETALGVAVVTVGTSEQVEQTVAAAFESAGHAVTVRERLRGDYDTLQQVVDRLVGRGDVDVVVTAGGIGIAADEVTVEAVHPLLAKALPGFGEAFRALLFEEIGTGIVAVRSTAGVADGTLVFCLPGDVAAANLAVEEILVPEAPELVAHLG